MNKKILAIVAHRDDEVLGAGATLFKHVKDHDEVYCLILGESVLCRKTGSNLNQETLEAGKIIGFKDVLFENFPDNKFDSVALFDVIQKIEKHITDIKPDVIYTHWENDLNIDHRVTFEAVMTACRPCNDNAPKKIYSFEVLSSSEWQLRGGKFKPNTYINIKKEIKTKIRAMQEYKSEIRQYPHSRSSKGIEILANCRGLECGKEYVEAFYLVKSIV